MRFSRCPSGVKKTSTGQTFSRFRGVFCCWSCYVSFRLAQSQGAVLVSQPLQLNCTWQSCLRHQPYPVCHPTHANNQWWFSKQEEDIVSTSKTFPPLKASTIFEPAGFRTRLRQRFGVDKGWIEFSSGFVQTRNKSWDYSWQSWL